MSSHSAILDYTSELNDLLTSQNGRKTTQHVRPFPSPILQHLELGPYRTLSDLLPRSSLRTKLCDRPAFTQVLSHLGLVLELSKKTIKALENCEYHKFDALIGNNSCALSAFNTCLIADQMKLCTVLKRETRKFSISISQACQKLQKTLERRESYRGKRDSFLEYMQDEKLDITIPHAIHLAVMYYGCSFIKRRDVERGYKMDYSTLLNIDSLLPLQVGQNFAARLIQHWQKKASCLSVEFIQSLVRFNPGFFGTWGEYIMPDHVVIDHKGRKCCASLYALRIMLLFLKSYEGIHTCLRVSLYDQNGEYLRCLEQLYSGSTKSSALNFKQISIEETDLDAPIYVISGCSYNDVNRLLSGPALNNRFFGEDLEEICLSHEVTYPQFPKATGCTELAPKHKCILQTIDRLRKKSGYSLDNPSNICLAHLYADSQPWLLSRLMAHPQVLPCGRPNERESNCA